MKASRSPEEKQATPVVTDGDLGNKRRLSISLSVLISFGYKSVFVLVAAEELK